MADNENRLVITFGGEVIFDDDVDSFECNRHVPMRRYYEDRIIPEPVPPATLELKATQNLTETRSPDPDDPDGVVGTIVNPRLSALVEGGN